MGANHLGVNHKSTGGEMSLSPTPRGTFTPSLPYFHPPFPSFPLSPFPSSAFLTPSHPLPAGSGGGDRPPRPPRVPAPDIVDTSVPIPTTSYLELAYS